MFLYNIRVKIYNFRKKKRYKRLLHSILEFYKSEQGKEYSREIEYITENGLCVFPYSFSLNYVRSNIQFFWENGLPYTKYRGKNLFLLSGKSEDYLKSYMNTILIEQDFNSPHRYIDEEFNVDQDETVFDIGAADGNFSLEVVDRCDKIFLFESNTQWISPLSKTFENYGDKVEIINKKAGDKNDKSTVKIDSIVGEVKNNLFFKIDVDGFEREVLKGMCNILRSAVGLKIAICTYHNQDDAVEFEIFFKNLGFETSFTPGVMLFHYDKKIRKPFFRKGVLKAYKPENRDKKS